PNVLETTTVKDGHLPINVSVPTAPASVADTATPPVPVPETPILVTTAEVTPAEEPNGAGLAEEVESLSGEIQALEAKIDRLTGSVKPVADSSSDTHSNTNLPADAPKPTEPIETASSPIPATPPSPVPPTPPPPTKSESKTVGINDIYSKVGQRQKEADSPSAPGPDDAEDVSSGSSIGTIGEVLAVFGVIIFLIMSAFPFYESLMPENIIEAIRSIGWPTAVVSLALGFLMSLFSHGKVATKIFMVIILILAIVLYLGVVGFQSYLGPLGPMLESIFSFYR
ncbi:MAG: hypothetical protein Q8Q05_02805, partial [bacterium]|nr:hypothetical protein [bacterium]